MKTSHLKTFIIAIYAAMHMVGAAATIEWNVRLNGANFDSSGKPMDSGFIFELGVFSAGFEPTASNIADWDARWHLADAATYNPRSKAFGSSYQIETNAAPFTAGAAAWIMGTKVTPTGTEKILFRRTTWTWPTADLPDAPGSFPREWTITGGKQNLVAILASVNPDGAPHLMQSTVIRNYGQWKKFLAANGADQGLEDDGSVDLLSFVFDTGRPEDRGRPPFTPISKVRVNGQDHLQIEIPRNRAHLARLNVQVSSDLVNWVDGAAHTEVVSDGPFGLVVRDKTPASVHNGKRFMRVQIQPVD